MVDALPDALIVVDRDYNVILANQVAREQSGCSDGSTSCKCYTFFHRRTSPCSNSNGEMPEASDTCPVRRVFETKTSMRDYHTHYNAEGKATSVAVDAAPVMNEAGEVAYVLETCRDVTERSLSRRLLRIGNRHMQMQPLLEEYAAEIRQYAGCASVGFHILDDLCSVFCGNSDQGGAAAVHTAVPGDDADASCMCLQLLCRDLKYKLPISTRRGSLRFDHFSDFMAAISDASRDQVNACGLLECESVALIPIRLDAADLGLLYVADPRPHVFTAGLVESLERLSLELATAIQRVRIQEELRGRVRSWRTA